jgi:chromosome segregation ATPase
MPTPEPAAVGQGTAAAKAYIGVLERVLHAHREHLTASDIAALAGGAATFRKATDAAQAAKSDAAAATHPSRPGSQRDHGDGLHERALRANLALAKQAQSALRRELEDAKRAEALAEARSEQLASAVEALQEQQQRSSSEAARAPARQDAADSEPGILNDTQRQAMVRLRAASTALEAVAAPVAIMASDAVTLAATSSALAACTKLATTALAELESVPPAPAELLPGG